MNTFNLDHTQLTSFLSNEDIHQYLHFQNENLSDIYQINHEYKYCFFENMTFQKTTFDNCYFMDVIFKNCDLSNIQLLSTLFRRTHFINCKLLGTDFSESIFDDVFIKDCQCCFMNLAYMKNKVVSFENCDFHHASFIDVHFKKTKFHECIFSQCEVLHSSFYHIDLSTCSLEQIITTPEDIKGAIINEYQASSLIHLLSVKIKSV